MRNFTLCLVASMGFFSISAVTVMGGNNLGNQLQQGSSAHWYEKAAETTGPASEISPKGSALWLLQPGSFLYMEGDSTLHKYQMRAGSLQGSAALKGTTGKDPLEVLKAGTSGPMALVISLQNLKSKESGLDDNAYKALKAKDFPEIRFTLKSGIFDPKTSVFTAQGTLTVAGTVAPVTLTAEAKAEGNQLHLKGIQKLKMSDFKVTPPSISLLVTSITCTDEIEIHYDVLFAEATK